MAPTGSAASLKGLAERYKEAEAYFTVNWFQLHVALHVSPIQSFN